jgi:hypothetical protein
LEKQEEGITKEELGKEEASRHRQFVIGENEE